MRIIFNSLDEVPEHLRESVKKDDSNGTFILEGDGADGIIKKNKELIDLNKQYKAAADKWKELKDVDPEKAKKAMEEMSKLEEERGKLSTAIQSAVAEAAKEWQGKIKVVENERDTMRASLEERIIDADLTSAVAAAEGVVDFVVPALRGQVKTFFENGKYVAKVVDDKGQPRFNAKGEPMSMADLVAGAKADKKFAPVFKAPAASGSGAQPGSGNTNVASGQVVKLTQEQAKDSRQFRQALDSVKGDYSKVVIEG